MAAYVRCWGFNTLHKYMSNFGALSSYLWHPMGVFILPLKTWSQKQISIKQFNYSVTCPCCICTLGWVPGSPPHFPVPLLPTWNKITYKGTNLCTRAPHSAFLAISCMRGSVFKHKRLRNTRVRDGYKALTPERVRAFTNGSAYGKVCANHSCSSSRTLLQQSPPSLLAQGTARKRPGWLRAQRPPRNKASIHPKMRRSTPVQEELPLVLPHPLRLLSLYVALILHTEFCKKPRSVTSESKTQPFLGGQRKTPADAAGALLQHSKQSRIRGVSTSSPAQRHPNTSPGAGIRVPASRGGWIQLPSPWRILPCDWNV